MKKIDFTGTRIGQLTVIREAGKDKFGHIQWLCKCDCGNETIVLSDNIKRKHSKSCGCLRTNTIVALNQTHGMTHTRIYTVWVNMVQRCNNPNSGRNYEAYGKRGIKVDSKWLTFDGFMEDMGDTYRDCLTLDRIDVNGNYTKQNCRWVEVLVQANNKRNNRFIEVRGKRATIPDLAREYKVPSATLWARIYKLGWSIDKALTEPIRRHS
ncbi:hypothetical protein [Cohnella kolymensis]|uniref:hypothetical protein n=1 Tax=Cohnella kolymensis TaxID=1590652 RepID=UPI0006968D8A|nr:hypothetical protein [Cohnella kolymensis]